MELLLLEDIPGIGRQHDIIVVKEGFALNNLLPRRRAIVATPTVRKRYEEQIRRRAIEKAQEAELARSAMGVLKDKTLTFTRKATDAGKLYASVSEKAIADALSEQLHVEVAESDVVLTEHVKTIGQHTAKVKVGGQEVTVRMEVKAESSEGKAE